MSLAHSRQRSLDFNQNFACEQLDMHTIFEKDRAMTLTAYIYLSRLSVPTEASLNRNQSPVLRH